MSQSTRLQQDLALAHELADAADSITLPLFRSAVRRRTKADGTIVTEADEAAERTMREILAAKRPGDAILGEEQGLIGSGSRRWILDPIDGTKSYAWGIPLWGTLIALQSEDEVVAGVVSAPAIGERWAAAKGLGTTLNGEPVAVSGVEEISAARVSYNIAKCMPARLGRACLEARGYTDFWPHLLVACGALDVTVDPVVNTWDVAALIVLVEEAGGRLTDSTGARRIDGGSCVSTNARLHDKVIELLA